MNLILVDPEEVAPDGRVHLSGNRGRHLRDVLKVVPGDRVRMGVIDGQLGYGAVTAATADSVDLFCEFQGAVPERPPIDLLLALPRPKVLQRLWAPLAALGVSRIVLTNAARVERHYFDTHVLTESGYGPLLIEGLQQARDTRLPVVSIHKQFRKLVEDDLDGVCGPGLRLVAHPDARLSVADAVRPNGPERLVMAIGPEGGWNAFELALLESRGFHPVGMGYRTLRTDTAAVALIALAHDALGQPRTGSARRET